MKRLICTITMLMLLAGCAGMQNNAQLGTVAVELAGFNVGYYVGKDKPAADIPIRNAYTLARTGQLPPEAVGQALAELKISDPLLAGNCLIVLKAMGAGMLPDGQVGALSGITPEMWDAAQSGYVQGFAIGQAKAKK